MAKVLTALFLAASVVAGTAAPADAAPMSKCRNTPQNYSRYHGKCLTEKRIEILKDRRGEAHHGANHQ